MTRHKNACSFVGMSEPLTLSAVVEIAKSQARLAAIVGVTQQAISLRLRSSGADAVPIEWAPKIEAALGIPRHELRPDIFGPPPAKDAAA